MNSVFVGMSRMAFAVAILILSACGGGRGTPPPISVGGTVTGLAGSGLVLTDNGSDHLAVSGNGSFTFATAIPAGGMYDVLVLTQPTNPSQTCSVGNGSGQAGSTNMATVTITCTTNTYTVSGSIAGLDGSGLVLADNGGDQLSVAVNGSFTFATPVASGAGYDVAVAVQPTDPGQRCVVSDGSGTMGSGNLAGVTVTCTTSTLKLFAGNFGGPVGGDGFGAAIRFYFPLGVATDTAGNVYVADEQNSSIVKITPDGVPAVLAGTVGVIGSNDGTGTAARFYFPSGLALDGSGTIYVADRSNHVIRKITSAGVVTTLAGQAGVPGSADGAGNAAQFNYPFRVAADKAGNLYVSDEGGNTIRMISPDAVVTTLAGTSGFTGSANGKGPAAQFDNPAGVALDAVGLLYVADSYNEAIRRIAPDGVVTTFAGTAGVSGSADGVSSAARFSFPTGVATDAAGDLFVADSNNFTIRKITPDGNVTTLAGTAGLSGSSDGLGTAARFVGPADVAADRAGNVFVVDTSSTVTSTIRKIAPGGSVTTFAGEDPVAGNNDDVGAAARFSNPHGITSDSTGNLYVADSADNTIRKITPDGVVATFAGGGGEGEVDGIGAAASFNYPWDVATDSSGNVYVSDSMSGKIRKVTPDRVVTTLASGGKSPASIATDTAGNVYVADPGSCTILEISPAGVVQTLAGTDNSGYSQPIGKYPPDYHPCSGSADGVGTAALFSSPSGIATNHAGTIFVADSGNNTIRKITPGGVVKTFAGAAGISGNADGAGSSARFSGPLGLATDSDGNVYVADTGNNAIRRITPAGVVSTVVGGGPGQSQWRFMPGQLPGLITLPWAVAISGSSLYITFTNGVAVVENVP